MIISAMIGILKIVIQPILWVLPTLESLPDGLSSAIDWFFDGLAGITYFVNFGPTLLQILNLSFFYVILIAGFAILNWVLNKLRGSG